MLLRSPPSSSLCNEIIASRSLDLHPNWDKQETVHPSQLFPSPPPSPRISPACVTRGELTSHSSSALGPGLAGPLSPPPPRQPLSFLRSDDFVPLFATSPSSDSPANVDVAYRLAPQPTPSRLGAKSLDLTDRDSRLRRTRWDPVAADLVEVKEDAVEPSPSSFADANGLIAQSGGCFVQGADARLLLSFSLASAMSLMQGPNSLGLYAPDNDSAELSCFAGPPSPPASPSSAPASDPAYDSPCAPPLVPFSTVPTPGAPRAPRLSAIDLGSSSPLDPDLTAMPPTPTPKRRSVRTLPSTPTMASISWASPPPRSSFGVARALGPSGNGRVGHGTSPRARSRCRPRPFGSSGRMNSLGLIL